jgi:hypothetical protein
VKKVKKPLIGSQGWAFEQRHFLRYLNASIATESNQRDILKNGERQTKI